MKYIREYYGVPAKRGMRVTYSGSQATKTGVITSARGANLMIRIDGMKHPRPYHPTWELSYGAES
jgi:hypothetical protein